MIDRFLAFLRWNTVNAREIRPVRKSRYVRPKDAERCGFYPVV